MDDSTVDETLDVTDVSPGYSASLAEEEFDLQAGEGHDWVSVQHQQFSGEHLPFRAIDLLDKQPPFGRSTQSRSQTPAPDLEAVEGADIDFFGPLGGTEEQFETHEGSASLDVASVHSLLPVEHVEGSVHEEHVEQSNAGPVVSSQTWNELVAGSFAQFRQLPPALLFPWEQGPMAAVFDFDRDPLPQCPGLSEMVPLGDASNSDSLRTQLTHFALPESAKYLHAVKSIQDLSYFDSKSQQLELACSQWLRILSVSWSSSGVGPQLVEALRKDHTGREACEILRACFGIKSPSTLLKRAGSFKKFFSWFEKSPTCQELGGYPLPLNESIVWEYFLALKQQRCTVGKGYTIPSSFLEAVRFAKFTLDLQGTDSILGSRRLLGFSALERQAKGPTLQAPALSPEHIRRLHEVLHSASNAVDRLGAGCFLICLYGRARWSDMLYINHVVIEYDEWITFYTTEHKTASVGLRREQYLPIVVPWSGICSDDWVRTWLEVYAQVGLDITKKPLGPLLPAPRADASFCARPLSTSEAATWLRALLQGTTDNETFRSHSLKATLLNWCARAGFDKETRSVLGHHCSAISGSEVVYSRQLQVRALRKLALILRRVRGGLSIEDEAMREYGVVTTPAPFTPGVAARTPVVMPPVVQPHVHVATEPAVEKQAVDQAVETAVVLEELQSAKEEELSQQELENAATDLTLFPVELVAAGVVEIESSSGSSSDSDTSDSYSTSSEPVAQAEGPQVIEMIPDGTDFFRHVKSGLVHSCKVGEQVSSCKIQLGANFKKLGRRIYVVHPKCIRCFPRNNNRIRTLEQMTEKFDAFLKKAKASGSKGP